MRQMKERNPANKYKTTLVLFISFLALFLPIIIIEAGVLRYTNGVFMYPFDDTFIHLEIAQKLATQGVWGINDHQFGAASSSLLYTVILTLCRFISASTIVPFVINCIAGVFIILFLYAWLKKQGVNTRAMVCVMLAVIFFTPLATLIVSGMEHTLQTLLCFLFVFHFSHWLQRSIETQKKQLPWYVVVYAVLLASVRYEGLFIIAIAALMLLYYKNWREAVKLVFFASLPVIIFGIYSVSKGSYFLPNSILIKSDTLNKSGAFGFLSDILFEKLTYARNGMGALATQRWMIVLPLACLVFKKYLPLSYTFILLLLTGGTLLHLSLAATGTLYRYEAYLFFSSLVIVALLFFKYGKEVFATQSWQLSCMSALLLFFLFFPVVLRGLTAIDKTKQGCINIFDQQYQMGQFSRKYYYNSTIAANDIGAIAYYTDARIVDLWGLATIEVAKSKKHHYWTPQFLDSLCKTRGVKTAMIYDSWFSDSLTSRWKKAATWKIQNNVICGDDTVSFYAVDSTNYSTLSKNLRRYQSSLPASVEVMYY